MKKMFSLLMVLCLACVSVYAQDAKTEEVAVAKEEKNWSVNFSLTLANKYVTDAHVNTDGLMLFPDLSVSFYGAFVGIWGAFDLNKWNDEQGIDRFNFEEVDYYAGYGYTFEDIPGVSSISITGTYFYYDYPHRAGAHAFGAVWDRWDEEAPRNKITLDVCTGSIAETGITAGATLEWLYDHRDGCNKHWGYGFDFYAKKGFAIAAISEKLTFDNKIDLFVFNHSYSWRRRGVAAFQYTAALNYACCDNVSFGPFASFMWQLEKRAREEAKANNAQEPFDTLFGFAVNAAF